MNPTPTAEQLDAAAADAAAQLKRLGAVGLRTRRMATADGLMYEIECRVQRGRVASKYTSELSSNIVVAALDLIASIKADVSTGGRKPKPKPVEAPVERMLGLPDVVAQALRTAEQLDLDVEEIYNDAGELQRLDVTIEVGESLADRTRGVEP